MIRLTHLNTLKAKGEKIAALTAYDASFSHLLETQGVEVILVGDSLGMVIQGYPDTLRVSLPDIIYHTQQVVRGCQQAFIMADLPFGTYGTLDQALQSATALIRAGAAMVKIEGGAWLAETVAVLQQRGIPVCAHVGLAGQFIHSIGGYRIQGRDDEEIDALITDVQALQTAGASMLVLECVSLAATAAIMAVATVPVIGIGAGPETDGQILVTYDAIGLTPRQPYKFVRNFMDGKVSSISEAIKAYVMAVKQRTFPSLEHCFICK